MPDRTKKALSSTGEYEQVEAEPQLDREPKRPTTLPEVEMIEGTGSTTGVMRIRREGADDTATGDEDNPV